MGEPLTPEIVRVPSLDGLAFALRNYANTAGNGAMPDGQPVTDEQRAADKRTPDERVGEAYAHAALLVEVHMSRLREQQLDKLNAPDLRARLALVEGELTRARQWSEMIEREKADAIRAALDLPPEHELGDLGISSVHAERQKWRDDHLGACKTLAAMHAAAMGGVVRGPVHGVVEDVWNLRAVCEKLAAAAGQYVEDGAEADPDRLAALRAELGNAYVSAYSVLRPADAEEHRDPIDTVNAIRDVIECRSTLARVATELDELPRLPASERKARRENLRDLCRQYAGEPPYEQVETRAEILLTLLHDAWGIIANAGVHRGGWEAEHPDWVEAAVRWRDRFHAACGLVELGLLSARVELAAGGPSLPTDTTESGDDAARRFARELWRLESGLAELGIAADGPVGTAAVDTALRLLAQLEQPTAEQVAAAKASIEQQGPQVIGFGPDVVLAAAAAVAPTPEPIDPEAAAMLPELAEYADDPAAEPNEALLRDVAAVAAGYRGLAYDPHDRPEEILAVRRAAYRAGLVPFPSEALAPPRGYRGATPPEVKPKLAGAAVVRNTTGAPLTLAPSGDTGHHSVTLHPGQTLVVTAVEPSTT